jgi:hypothetical protein
MPAVREFAGPSALRTTELYFVRKEENAEKAARHIPIRGRRASPGTTLCSAFSPSSCDH